jgi:hypothetical protein
MRAIVQAHLAEARIRVQIDIGFGDAITPAALDQEFPTLLVNMAPPNVLAYPTETIVAEKVETMVDLGRANSRMKDFTDLAMAARRVSFDGDALVAAIRATFRRRQTPVPDGEIIALTEEFTGDDRAQANWRAFAGRNQLRAFDSLAQVVAELRPFLLPLLGRARTAQSFAAHWSAGGPWVVSPETED